MKQNEIKIPGDVHTKEIELFRGQQPRRCSIMPTQNNCTVARERRIKGAYNKPLSHSSWMMCLLKMAAERRQQPSM